MNKNLKQAFFSALLVWAVAFPVLGLKLSIDGISLVVHSQARSPSASSPCARC